ncbi:MAG: FadR family transcriptional regulator [Comamonadaceae bacterium]|nr:FadR family transcriptional regulator [Comamonadaceae bacterium]
MTSDPKVSATDNSDRSAPAATRPLPDEIAASINAQMQRGELLPGDRLPSERELCEMHDVSRSVVREALSQLKSDGIIETRRGSGAYVLERDQRQSFRMQDVAIDERDSLALVMELIVTVEVAATRLAAKRRTAEDLKMIRRALIGMEYEIASDRLGDEQDFAFHQAIVEATHNPHFIALSSHLEQGARRVIRQARTNTRYRHIELIEAVQQEHQAIFDAIKQGDPDAAEHAANAHLENAAKRLDMYLKN